MTPLTALPSRCRGRYVPGRRQVVVEHDQGGDENFQLSLLDLTELPETPVGLDGLTPLVADPDHLHVLLDVTESSVVYCTNRRNGVDMDVVVRDLVTGEERVVYDGGGYVASTVVSHDEKSVAVTMISLEPGSTFVVVADGSGSRTATYREEQSDHEVAGWTADDAALVLSSDHEREFHAVLRLGRHGSWTDSGGGRRPRRGRPAVSRRQHDGGVAPRRRPRPVRRPPCRRHPRDRCRPRARGAGEHRVGAGLVGVRDHGGDADRPGLAGARGGPHRRRVGARRRPRRRPGGGPRPARHPDRAPGPDARRRADPVLPLRRGRRGLGCLRRPHPRRARRPRRRRIFTPDLPGARPGGLRRARAQRPRAPPATGSAGCRWTTSSCAWTPSPTSPRSTRGCPASGSTSGGRRCGAARTAATWCWPASRCSPTSGPRASTSSACRPW